MSIVELLADWYRWRCSGDRSRLDAEADRMRRVDAAIEAMPEALGAVVREMAAGRALGMPAWHHQGGQGRVDNEVRWTEQEALAQLAHRLGW